VLIKLYYAVYYGMWSKRFEFIHIKYKIQHKEKEMESTIQHRSMIPIQGLSYHFSIHAVSYAPSVCVCVRLTYYDDDIHIIYLGSHTCYSCSMCMSLKEKRTYDLI
jgi:hypothetical protein